MVALVAAAGSGVRSVEAPESIGGETIGVAAERSIGVTNRGSVVSSRLGVMGLSRVLLRSVHVGNLQNLSWAVVELSLLNGAHGVGRRQGCIARNIGLAPIDAVAAAVGAVGLALVVAELVEGLDLVAEGALHLSDGASSVLAAGDTALARQVLLDHAVGEHVLGLPIAVSGALESVFQVSQCHLTWLSGRPIPLTSEARSCSSAGTSGWPTSCWLCGDWS